MHYKEVGDLCIVKQDDGAVSHSSTEKGFYLLRGRVINYCQCVGR